MEVFSLEVSYQNQRKNVKCVQSKTFFVMDPEGIEATKNEMKSVKGASFDKETKDVIYYSGGKEVRRFNEETDPASIILKPKLHKTPFIPDVSIEGSLITDYTYFRKQREAYRKSVTWKLHSVMSNRKDVKKLVNNAIRQYDHDIKIQRGVDISVDLPMPREDVEIMQMISQRAFRAAQSKMPCTA